MERIAVLHDEFAAAHDAKTGPALITKLALDLVEMHRQLAVALDFIAGDVGDHLFRGRLDDKVAIVTIFEAQQFRAIGLPAS